MPIVNQTAELRIARLFSSTSYQAVSYRLGVLGASDRRSLGPTRLEEFFNALSSMVHQCIRQGAQLRVYPIIHASSRCDRSMINPLFCGSLLGMAPKRLTCTSSVSNTGPTIFPCTTSFSKFSSTTLGLFRVDYMLSLALWHLWRLWRKSRWEPSLMPLLKTSCTAGQGIPGGRVPTLSSAVYWFWTVSLVGWSESLGYISP